jgi:2-C-methyl-D-erythritol 4-phosphate cytidylyltransferase
MTVRPDVAIILPAAGSGQRFGRGENKLFATLDDVPLWQFTAQRLRRHRRVARILMPVSEQDRPRFAVDFAEAVSALQIEIVSGGAERTDSVRNGLAAIADADSIRWVAVHDAARPLIRHADLEAVFNKAEETGAAILATPITATVKQSFDGGASCRTLDRSTLWMAQTPQVFRCDILRRAYEKHRGRPATDDAELVQRSGVSVALVEGSPDNLKITHPRDLVLAQAILAAEARDAANHHDDA